MTARILIVDDDSTLRNSIQEFLCMSSFEANAVDNADAALAFLKKTSVDLVITDIMMSGMDGLELTNIIKRDHDTDVIVITGFSSDFSYVEAISKGANDFIFKPVHMEELILRIKRVLRERALATERDQMLEQLKELAITDGLTKLYNSRYFYAQLDKEIDRQIRYHHPLSLLILDIDNFKHYNDTYGHLEGDKILQWLGGIICQCLRTMDSAYRYGGEEFTILLPETALDEAVNVANRIQDQLLTEMFEITTGDVVHVTMSIGVSEYRPREDISSFIHRADQAMYMSKEKGKNTVTALS